MRLWDGNGVRFHTFMCIVFVSVYERPCVYLLFYLLYCVRAVSAHVFECVSKFESYT